MPSFRLREADPDVCAALSRGLGLHPVTAHVLATRGIESTEQGRAFLSPDASLLHAPERLEDMDRAVLAVDAALAQRRRIAVYGDYDVDGVCGTALLALVLRFFGGEVTTFIPHRVRDGYGLSGAALEELRAAGCSLVVTVDNGTTRPAEIAQAQERGLAVVVTDHHEPGPELPPCPLVNPKRPDSGYPFTGLSGTGVAFKLAWALAEHRAALDHPGLKQLWPDLLALVAVGTVADVMPLQDENRALVAMGLQALPASARPGFRALLEVSGCAGRPLRADDIGWRLGPRINAAGRLGSAGLALDLLLCEDPGKAQDLAAQLETINRQRQRIDRRQSEQALERARAELERDPELPALVLWDAEWHPGVIGIVAARVAQTFDRPAVMLTTDGTDARGSARSFGCARLHELLDRCGEHLNTYGGHALAAGCTLEASSLDAFREAFLAAAAQTAPGPRGPREVDAELPVDAVSVSLLQEVERLAPFGAGNREPVFAACGLRTAGKRRLVGSQGKHLSFYAAGERSALPAIAFNRAEDEPLLHAPFDMAFALRRGSGAEPVELHVRAILPASS